MMNENNLESWNISILQTTVVCAIHTNERRFCCLVVVSMAV